MVGCRSDLDLLLGGGFSYFGYIGRFVFVGRFVIVIFMNTLKIFLASSAELAADRDEIREMISVENDRLHRRGIYLELVQWEYFFDALSPTRLQDEYNDAIKDCDLVLSLFFTKAGKYTQEEFETAYEQFKASGKPLIYTYFKKALVDVSALTDQFQILLNFKKHLSEIGHFYTSYDDINDFKYKFKLQLDLLLEKLVPVAATSPEAAPERGMLLYKIPPKMQLGNLHPCMIRIAYDRESLERQIEGGLKDAVEKSDIRMADSMEVVLLDNEAFEIQSLTQATQAVEKGDYTEWSYEVRPIKLGQFPLSFRVSIVLKNGPKQVVFRTSVMVVTEAVPEMLEYLPGGIVEVVQPQNPLSTREEESKQNLPQAGDGPEEVPIERTIGPQPVFPPAGTDDAKTDSTELVRGHGGGGRIFRGHSDHLEDVDETLIENVTKGVGSDRINIDKLTRSIDDFILSQSSACKVLVLAGQGTGVVKQLQADHAELERLASTRVTLKIMPLQLQSMTRLLNVAVKEKPNVLHFVGDGKQEMLGNALYEGAELPLSKEDLFQRLVPLQGIVRCVVLHGCYDAAQARAISTLGMVVVGWNGVEDDFVVEYYGRIGKGAGFVEAAAEMKERNWIAYVWKDGEEVGSEGSV
jgi:hypothetical protein